MMQLPGTKIARTRPLLALAAAGTIALSLWGSDDAAELDVNLPGLAQTAVLPGNNAAGSGSGRHSIAFPERAEAETAETSLFAGQSWYVAPPPPAPVEAPPPPAPTAPPLPFTFLGSFTPDGSPTVYYLVKGDSILDVHLGDTVDGAYTVDAVEGEQLVLTYTPLQQKQALSLRK